MTSKEKDKIVNGTQVITIQIEKLQQLFNSADIAPFRTQDLDDDFEEYLESCANEASHKVPMKIQIKISQYDNSMSSAQISGSIKSHFQHKIDFQKSRLKKHLKISRFFLFLGLGILTVCLILAHFLSEITTTPLLAATVREGLLILGWVSLWRPFEAIYDWYPYYDRIKHYQRIEKAQLKVSFKKTYRPKTQSELYNQ